MITGLLIISLAAVLLLYWLRSNCRMIAESAAFGDGARRVAAANRLRFPDALRELAGADAARLRSYQRGLLEDYRILRALLRHTAVLQGGGSAVERSLLAGDFWLMQAWFHVARLFSSRQARRALIEAARVLNHFANTIAKRAAAPFRV